MTISSHPDGAGQGRREDQWVQAYHGGCRGNINNNKPKKKAHVLSTTAIQHNVFQMWKVLMKQSFDSYVVEIIPNLWPTKVLLFNQN